MVFYGTVTNTLLCFVYPSSAHCLTYLNTSIGFVGKLYLNIRRKYSILYNKGEIILPELVICERIIYKPVNGCSRAVSSYIPLHFRFNGESVAVKFER